MAFKEGDLIPILQDNGLGEEALDMLAAEDIAQIDKWGHQAHATFEWYAIIGEEFGELGKAILEGDLEASEKEATQLATLALKYAYMVRKERA